MDLLPCHQPFEFNIDGDVSRWSAANKMVTNAAKMKCIPCKLDNCSLELKLVNCDIEQVDSQKLLGVTIDT